MRPSTLQIYPVLALLVLAGGTVWLERATRDEGGPASTEQRRDPDFTAQGTRLVSYDATGRQRYELLADEVVNYPFSRVTFLRQPRLRYDSDGREMVITAAAGEVLRGGEEVFLKGDVHVTREGSAESSSMTFASQTLRVWPDSEQAETRDPVVLTQGATTAKAQGLRADNLYGTLQLLGDVSVHMPRSSRNTR